MKLRIGMIPLVLGLALAGCDDDPTDPDDNGNGNPGCALLGSGNLNVSGAITATLSQCALYGVEPGATVDDPDFTVVAVYKGSVTAASHVFSLTFESLKPAPGTYDVGDLESGTYALLSVDAATDRSFMLTGTVTITTSGANQLNGSVNLTGTEIGASGTVQITGSFSAKCIDTSENDC